MSTNARSLKRILPALRRDCADIRWFIGRFVQKARPYDSPLLHVLHIYDQLDGSEPSKAIEGIEPGAATHVFHLSAAVQRLAWSIRALRDRNAFKEVHESFVTKEILGVDNTEPGVERKLPGG